MIASRHWRVAAATSALAVSAACAAATSGSAPGPAPTDAAIEVDDLRLRAELFASDAMAGRQAGTPGGAAAADYLSDELARLGLRPAGDAGSYLQSVPLRRTYTNARYEAAAGGSPLTLEQEDILPVSGLGGLPVSARTSGSGSLVFGGHVVDPEVGADELSLEQLQGAVLIVRLGLPEGVDAASATPRMSLAASFSPASPVAAVLLVAEEAEAEFWDYAADLTAEGELALASAEPPSPSGNTPPFFLISEETAEALIGAPLEEARSPRTGLGTFSFTIERRVEPIEAWNVVAVLPGSDASAADEYVTLGAHYDHVGVGAPVDGDSIYNGADDNASGSMALLEVAEALAHLPNAQRPGRSVLFIWNAAEESGLLGSEYFTDNPTVPRADMIAHVNLDMVGRNSLDSLFVVGSRRISTQLGDILETVNREQANPFVFDYSYDTPGHPEMIYCRSDHYNFARYGIPIVFLTSGLHDDYHAPSDHADLLDYEKMRRVSELLYDLVFEIGDLPQRPPVDQPVPPLGSPCQ